MSRTRCNRAAAVLVVTMIAFIATATAGPRSEAQSGRTVSVEPAGPYAPNQMVTVSWSGFKPGKTSVVLCERPQAASGNWAGCSEFTRVVGTTGADGTGSAPFRMHSHPPVVTHFEATNPRKFCADAFGGNNCAVVVSDCDVDIRAQHAARTNVDFTFVPPATRPEMILPARPEPVVDALGPQLPPEAPRLTAVGSKLAEEGTDAWAAAIAEEHGVLVDLTPVASTEVNAAVAARGAPFGVTAVPLDDAAHAALEAQGVGYTYVPLGVSAVAVGLGFNYGSASISEINLPSDVLARVYGKGNDSTPGEERITSFTNQPAIEAANGGCQFPVKIANNVFVAHYRGDRSAANLWFTSYLDAVEHDLYGHPGDFAFPASVGFTASMLTNDEIASSIYRGSYFSRADLDFVRDKVELDDSRGRWARIGFVELGSALDYHLTIATLTNGEGEPVRPTPDAILAGLEDPPPSGLLTDDDVFFPDFTAMPDTAYPMPIVFYAIVPTSHAGLPLGADGQPDVAWAQTPRRHARVHRQRRGTGGDGGTGMGPPARELRRRRRARHRRDTDGPGAGGAAGAAPDRAPRRVPERRLRGRRWLRGGKLRRRGVRRRVR